MYEIRDDATVYSLKIASLAPSVVSPAVLLTDKTVSFQDAPTFRDLIAAEARFPNPSTSGWILSSTTGGIRSWVAPNAHSHAISDVTGLQSALDAKTSLALGETSTTAYRGDRGKIAYDHSQITGSNPHNTTYSQVGAAAASHSHSISDVTGLQTSLDGKLGSVTADTTSRAANTVYAAPSGSAGTATFRALVAADIPSLDTGKLTSGTLGYARGGTGISAPGATAGNLRWSGSSFFIDTASYALASAIPAASSTVPSALGTAAVGTGTTWARADHVHAMPTAAQVGAASSSHAHTIADVTSLQAALDGKAASGHNHDAAYLGISATAASASKLATSRTLTIGATGKTFDGTSNVSWSLTEIGASDGRELLNWYSSRPTDCNLAPNGNGGIRSFKATSSMTANKPPQGNSHIIHMGWDNTYGWDTQIAAKVGNSAGAAGQLQVRGQDTGTWGAWRTIWDSGNLTNLNQLTNGPGFVSLSSVLTGYAVGANSALAATDTILGAFGKVQAQINARPGTVTSVGLTAPALMTVSGSPVTSSGSLALAWNGSSSNLVRADGSTISSNAFRLNGAAYVANGNLGSGYIKFASITIPVGSFEVRNLRWSLDGREVNGNLGRRSILTFAVRRNTNNSFDARFYLTDTGSDLTEEVTVRTNDGITWDFYVDGTTGGDCAYYLITPEINGMGAVTDTFVASASMPSYSTVIVARRYGYAHRLLDARTFTIGSTGKPFNGTADLSWSLAEIGALSTVTGDTTSRTANTVYAAPNGSAGTAAFRALVAADIPSLSGIYQPLDSDLTAIAALTTTTFGRSLLTQADAAAARALIDAAQISHTQSYSTLTSIPAAIDAIDGLTPSADRIAYYTGANAASLATLTPFARTLLDDADAAAARSTIGVAKSPTVVRPSADMPGNGVSTEVTWKTITVDMNFPVEFWYYTGGRACTLRLYNETKSAGTLVYTVSLSGEALYHMRLFFDKAQLLAEIGDSRVFLFRPDLGNVNGTLVFTAQGTGGVGEYLVPSYLSYTAA